MARSFPPEEITLRARRFVSGDRRASDLEAIFLWARERDLGRETVRDIGDFVAHRYERIRGKVLTHCAHVRAGNLARWYEAQSKQLELPKYIDALRSSAYFSDRAKIWKALRVKQKVAMYALDSAIAALTGRKDGVLSTSRPLTATEQSALKYFSSYTAVRPAYLQDELAKDLFEVLVAHRVLDVHSKISFLNGSEFISTFALTKMHLSVLRGEDGSIVELEVSRNFMEAPQGLGINAYFNVEGIPTRVGFLLFGTTCSETEWCSPSLLMESLDEWPRPLEIGSDGKICFIQ